MRWCGAVDAMGRCNGTRKNERGRNVTPKSQIPVRTREVLRANRVYILSLSAALVPVAQMQPERAAGVSSCALALAGRDQLVLTARVPYTVWRVPSVQKSRISMAGRVLL